MTQRSRNEEIKEASRFLRGTIAEGLRDQVTGAIAEDDTQLTKFHGIYLQDDRDLRGERAKKKLEKAFSFMARVRIPAGVLTPAQWIALHDIAAERGNATLRLTTRQTVQFHGIIKSNLRPAIQSLHTALLDTIAACGDVNRNVIASVVPQLPVVHAEVTAMARAISDHLLPHSRAWHEIWIDGALAAGGDDEEEPILGRTYLPRKFKIAIAVPPQNDTDVFAHDIGLIAIVQRDHIIGYNVVVGGGMGMTHGEPDTFPRTGDVIGFCRPEQVVAVCERIVIIQRDWGDRADRKHARLKYTLEREGLDRFTAELRQRLGYALAPARPYVFDRTGDPHGWIEGADGRAHYFLFVENGRVHGALLEALREITAAHDGLFVLTPNQNLVIANVTPEQRAEIGAVLDRVGLRDTSALRRNAMACVALPTCGLALAESERYLPDLISALDEELARHDLTGAEIMLRMTGCPNGCARPYLAEIGLVGTGPGRYNLYLGAAFDGSRLSKLYRKDLDHAGIVAALRPLLAAYTRDRTLNERFGDFVIRAGVVSRTSSGNRFHADVPLAVAD
ncbi:MAG TPA: NADPH-dependent assimilatory sulfite reductase hemoprotein subunit [Acetobacteraceae bacterium]|jgi:sulfite reductase (NADPH) hemoprotein beta-component|nr:NADPH-dependent assimilatory sulfite reductase hemoprotein subunit [Acetobacteraceae bacterium]